MTRKNPYISVMKINLMSLAKIFFIIGIASLIVYTCLLILSEHFSWTGSFDYSISGALGDFIGGVVGTFWAASGILLLYENYKLQKDEFKNTQNMVGLQVYQTQLYNSLKEIEEHIRLISYNENIVFSLSPQNKSYNGHDFLKLLYTRLQYLDNHFPFSVPIDTEELLLDEEVFEQLPRQENPIKNAQEYSKILETLLTTNPKYNEHLNPLFQKIKVLFLSLKSAFKNFDDDKYSSSEYNIFKLAIKSRLPKELKTIVFYYSFVEPKKSMEESFLSLFKETYFFDDSDEYYLFHKSHLQELSPKKV